MSAPVTVADLTDAMERETAAIHARYLADLSAVRERFFAGLRHSLDGAASPAAPSPVPARAAFLADGLGGFGDLDPVPDRLADATAPRDSFGGSSDALPTMNGPEWAEDVTR